MTLAKERRCVFGRGEEHKEVGFWGYLRRVIRIGLPMIKDQDSKSGTRGKRGLLPNGAEGEKFRIKGS